MEGAFLQVPMSQTLRLCRGNLGVVNFRSLNHQEDLLRGVYM